MTKQDLKQLFENKIVLLDGATGSNLQAKGMEAKGCPEEWILSHKEVLINLQYEYLQAGTDILYAPTFTANRIKLKEYGLEDQIEKMNLELVAVSLEARKRYLEAVQDTERCNKWIAGNLTMTGEQLHPVGKLSFEELVEVYKEQIRYLVRAGVDLLVIETMMSLQECRAAVIAAKETCDLPVFVTLTFGEENRTLYGTDPKTAVTVLQSLSVDAVGVNCSTGPEKMCEIIREMSEFSNIPLIAKPNAGLPHLVNGNTVFDMEAEDFAKNAELLVHAGANIVGGCCGTTPLHIQKLSKRIMKLAPTKMQQRHIHALTTERNTLLYDLEGAFLIIGERINPTGKKALQEELREGSFELVLEMAREQECLGANILDINMGMNGIDEEQMMLDVMEEVLRVTDLPLCIDSSHVKVIEAALRRYPGRALINSISLEKVKIEQLLPIAKKYGAAFILLPLSDSGLPKSMEEKKEILHTIYIEALRLGLHKEDIIVDGLVNTIGANKKAALETFETIRYCREELGLCTMVGLSNISFGLPERQTVNAAFLSMAMNAGLTMAIANPSQNLLMSTAYASGLLMNKEDADNRYIHRVTKYPLSMADKEKKSATTEMNKEGYRQTVQKEQIGKEEIHLIYQAVLKGNRRNIVNLIREELREDSKASHILDWYLIPAIHAVGTLFDQQKYYLPQLIASAEAMKLAVDYLEPLLKEEGDQKQQGIVVIATVEGDIHDIGKNLVSLMLKNYGFTVIDLGKDVKSETIIESAKQYGADIIALSALMTTTMQAMKQVVELRNEHGLSAKVVIGGAVITQSYCDEIHADGYSKDAQDAVVLVKKLLQK